MRSRPLLLLLTLLLPSLSQGESSLRLTGIMNAAGMRSAVLEVTDSRGPLGSQPVTLILGEGESEGEFEVTSIDLVHRAVQLRFHGTNLALVMPAVESSKTPTVQLTNAPLAAVLKFYGELTGLTLLQHPELTSQELSITSTASERQELVKVFAAVLTNAGVVSIPDGDKFLRILPVALAEKIQRIEIPARGTNEAGFAEKLPARAVDFVAAKFDQAAKIQAELINRKLESYEVHRATKDFVLKTQQPLTRAEIVYALDVQFAWRGMKLVALDDKLARLVPLDEK